MTDRHPLFRTEPMLLAALAAMILVVTASNILVQVPLGDWLTWGAFTYPLAFLVTDLTNRRFGPAKARRVVLVGFAIAVVLSWWLASPRLAIASGTAFLVAQLLDIAVFDRLRHGNWWKAPVISSVVSSLVDTAIFFSLAFAAIFAGLGAADAFAGEALAVLGGQPRWIGWALGDLAVKLALAPLLLAPYRLLMGLFDRRRAVA
jgi:uncharacterized PurR-regulated membrane protein YhhQ (DUF165 family)